MYGADIERILRELEHVKQVALYDIDAGMDTLVESIPAAWGIKMGYNIGPIGAAMVPLTNDIIKMRSLRNSVYAGSKNFNDSIASPWAELETVQTQWTETYQYWVDHGVTGDEWFANDGEKVGMMGQLNAFITTVCDAKYPLMIFHHTIQQGWDHMHGNTPSITWADDLNGRRTIGQGTQSYNGQNKPSKDPY